MKSQEITLRSIQHYMYCPHRWGLIEINKSWGENIFVTKANLLHDRVHDPEKSYTGRGKKVYTSVPVYNDDEQYNLYGVTDCIELKKDKTGITIKDDNQRYKLTIVEYKPTKPKEKDYREDDLMQVFAQKLCVDSIFGGDCDGVLYYADVKKRISLPLKENFEKYNEELKRLLTEMRDFLKAGKIPPIRKNQNCNGCSMKDVCMPSMRKIPDLKKEIKKIEREPLCENS